VFTTARKRDDLDWNKDFSHFGVGTTVDATVAGVLTVDSYNNIHKYTDIRDSFVVLDEQRLVGSGVWVKSFLKIAKHNRWIMLSATPGDTWLDYIPLMIANGFYRNKTEFLREHVVFSSYAKFPKVERFINTGKLVRLRRELLVEMSYARETVREFHDISVNHDKDLFEKVWVKRWHVYEERPIRDVAETFLVARKVSNSDPSRLLAIREILKEHPRIVVFYSFNFEREILRELAEDVDVLAEWSGWSHEPVPKSNSWVYLVQYAAGAEAWNCVTTDTMVFYSLPYSYRNFVQAQGRIDRLNTPYRTLHYYVLQGDSNVDKAVRKSLREKRDFNEREYIGQRGLQ
jgi:hypothetical protein